MSVCVCHAPNLGAVPSQRPAHCGRPSRIQLRPAGPVCMAAYTSATRWRDSSRTSAHVCNPRNPRSDLIAARQLKTLPDQKRRALRRPRPDHQLPVPPFDPFLRASLLVVRPLQRHHSRHMNPAHLHTGAHRLDERVVASRLACKRRNQHRKESDYAQRHRTGCTPPAHMRWRVRAMAAAHLRRSSTL